MITQLPRPGVKHADKAQLRAEVPWAGCGLLHGCRAFLEERGIGQPGFVLKGRAQLFGHGEGDQEAGHRQQIALMPIAPCLRARAAAPGTVAMVAAMPAKVRLRAPGAPVQVAAIGRSAAAFDRAQGPPRRRRGIERPAGGRADAPAACALRSAADTPARGGG